MALSAAAAPPEHICRLAEAGRGWPRLVAALSVIWRWRDAPEGEVAEASGRLLSTRSAVPGSAAIAATRCTITAHLDASCLQRFPPTSDGLKRARPLSSPSHCRMRVWSRLQACNTGSAATSAAAAAAAAGATPVIAGRRHRRTTTPPPRARCTTMPTSTASSAEPSAERRQR
eukprot:scaffold449_cov59-Phaeocystis_antarctica.AAC.2